MGTEARRATRQRTRWKAFGDLLEAARLARRAGADFSLVLVGEALPEERAYEEELRQQARASGLEDTVFTGWRRDVPAAMQAASVFVLPSHGEPFGRVVV